MITFLKIQKPIAIILLFSFSLPISCNKKSPTEPEIKEIQVSQDGSASGVTDNEGKIIFKSAQFGLLEFVAQDTNGTKLSGIRTSYYEENNVVKILFSDPNKKYANVFIW